MPKIRTISQAIEYLKSQDPNSAITEYYLRSLIKQNKIKYVKSGNRYLVNVNFLLDYLKDPPAEVEDNIVSLEKFKKTERR